ncbi:hypothetical protein VTO73DRAFT_12130 [Trametes versicolor]
MALAFIARQWVFSNEHSLSKTGFADVANTANSRLRAVKRARPARRRGRALVWDRRPAIADTTRMPRFLDTWTGEFVWESDPSQVTYAILSHVWRKDCEGGEQSYDEVRNIQAAVKKTREGPRSSASNGSRPTKYYEEGTIFAHPGLSDKIKHFCQVTRDAGFRLAWNDACCIDKSSSAELAEAINSMFEWYRNSDMCYVYLADVPDYYGPQDNFSSFPKSKWHTRGWTLQELIAPENVVFLSKTWSFLGTKVALAWSLQEITGVDFNVLVGRASLDSISVGKRMSWAAKRETTRVEDRAYSLMGIFGIHMSPIYGEGQNAFLRLQEEVIRTIPDHSIFVWGPSCRLLSCYPFRCDNLASIGNSDGDASKIRDLLASSPEESFSHHVVPTTSSALANILGLKSDDIPPINPIFTPEGVSMRLLCFPITDALRTSVNLAEMFGGSKSAGRGGRVGRTDMLALLQCRWNDNLVALPLYRPRQEGKNDHIWYIGTLHRPMDCMYRFFGLTKEVLMAIMTYVQPMAEEVLLLRRDRSLSVPKSLVERNHNEVPMLVPRTLFDFHGIVFEISPHSLDGLRSLGIVPSPLQVTRAKSDWKQELIVKTRLSLSGRDTQSVAWGAIELCIHITEDWERRLDNTSGNSGNSDELHVNNLAPSQALLQGAVLHLPLERGSMIASSASGLPDHSAPESAAIPSSAQVGTSDTSMEPRLSQKRSREASLCAELLGGRHPKRIRLAFPPTDDSVAEDWSILEHLDLHLPISEIGQCGNDGRHGRRVSYRSTSEDCTCVGSTGDGIETVPEQEAEAWKSSAQNEDSAVFRAATTLESLAKLNHVTVHDASRRSEIPVQQADELDTFNTLMHENDALRTRTSAMGAQIADLETTNAEVRAEMSELRVKMADMLNRLNDLAESQALYVPRDGNRRIAPS